jgi:uncharacterized membrane protein YphA (DoxX/SURF4 family)
MTVVRRLARPLLAASFVTGGLDSLRNPKPQDDPLTPALASRIRYLPEDPEALARVTGAVQVGGGALLALGKLPRLSAALLAASLVPTALSEHRFWDESDPQRKSQQRASFLKDLGLLGGLVLASVDTEGRPGLVWRARHASHHAATRTRQTRRAARREARRAARAARGRLPG